MNRDDIIRMAVKAYEGLGPTLVPDATATKFIERFAALVAERDTSLLRQALEAMEAYDQRGTAALMWDAIAALRERLGS